MKLTECSRIRTESYKTDYLNQERESASVFYQLSMAMHNFPLVLQESIKKLRLNQCEFIILQFWESQV